MDTSIDLLSRFADAADPGTRRGALIDLIKTKQLHKVASNEAFQRGLGRLARSAQDAGQDTDRLLGVAALLHAAATAPSIRASVESLVRSAVSGSLSRLHELPDVHDRLYAARSWRVVPAAWSLDALATAAAREESGEAVRKECIEAIVGLATKIEKAVSALREALLAVTFETKKPGDSLARRLNRVFAALTDSLSRSHKPVGGDIGREISNLVERGFRAAGRPESPAVRVDVVEHVAVLTHAIVRADFSLAGHDKTYEALSVVSEWFRAREWEQLCESSKAAEAISRVRDDVAKSLLLLAGAGKPDDQLRRALATAAGSRRRADAICRKMAMEHPGIPDEVRDWLARVSPRTRIASAVESRERSIDEVLAELLIDMTRLASASRVVRSDVLPDVSIVLPQSMHALSRLTDLADSMANKLNLVVAWRSLRIRGTVGQEVEFSPVEHRFSTAGTRSRRVRLLSPVVERVSEDGVPRVVLKAAVEPASRQPEPAAEAGGVSA